MAYENQQFRFELLKNNVNIKFKIKGICYNNFGQASLYKIKAPIFRSTMDDWKLNKRYESI